jgi:thiol-disulfide isomerase/thioredoxin
MVSADARKKAAPAVLPALQTMIGLFVELKGAQPTMAPQIDQQMVELRMLQLVFGDPGAQEENAKAVAAGNVVAAGTRAAANYIVATDDPTRLQAITAFDTALQRDPGNDSLGTDLEFMINFGVNGIAPSPTINAKLLSIVQNDAKGSNVPPLRELLESQIKLQGMENKPLTLEGIQENGAQFSTAQWKGKVILVDFWATWCPPCVSEIPAIEKNYAEYHAKGLEVVGVSSDNSDDDLKKFLSANPDMVWPQLFDAKSPGLHALAKQYEIIALPAMFLIDRNGILRTSQAAAKMDEMIPQLLAEKVK